MTGTEVAPEKTDDAGRALALVLFVLTFLEAINFAPHLKQVGFYLDDWLMLQTLRFGPPDFFGALANYFLTDPKVVIRPVEALHFGSLYFLSGLKPIGYHLSNCIFEVMAAALAYLALARLTKNRMLSFLVALGVLLYPVHDSTHYWILCCSVAFSLSFYFTSLWLSIEGAIRNRYSLHVWSALALAVSIYSYEVYLPLAAINSLCVLMILRNAEGARTLWDRATVAALKAAVLSFIPLFLVGLSLLLYQRLVVPHIAVGYLHRVTLDPARILYVILEGAKKSFPIDALSLCRDQIGLLFLNGVSPWQWVMLASGGIVSMFALAWLIKSERDFSAGARELILMGLATVVVSFSIFGLNTEYEPALQTIVNRINVGAAFGWSCVFAGIAGLILGRVRNAGRLFAPALIVTTGLMIAVFTATNWQLAQPWVVSWRSQSDIFYLMKKRAGTIASDECVILTDCPRYVMCSPVFDGIWDFQSMVRIALNDSKVKAGVVSERLRMAPGELQDVSMGYMCAFYPFEKVKVFVPRKNLLSPAPSARRFIEIVEQYGSDSRLAAGTTERWRKQAEYAEKAASGLRLGL